MDAPPPNSDPLASPGLPVSASALLARLLERSGEGIVVLRPERDAAGELVDFTYALVNPAAARMLGHEADALVGRSLRDAYPGTLVTGIYERYAATLRTGEPQTTEFHYTHDGLATWFKQEVTRLGDALVVTTTDTTAAKRAEAYKDDFLAVLSHELRTPLNFITGFASILEDELQGPLNAEQRESLSKILEGADRMLDIVEGLLAFARVRAGALTLAPDPTPWPPLLRGVVEALAGKARASRVAVRLGEVADVAPEVDGPRIRMAIWHLLDNAIKFTGAGGDVRLDAFVRGDRLRTVVTDTGIGIAPEAQARLFERFHQIDMTSTRAVGGTGLGLALVQGLVEAHGGAVGVESTPGRGSAFWFEVPMVAAPPDGV